MTEEDSRYKKECYEGEISKIRVNKWKGKWIR